jgi:hypothetical protein
MVDARLFVGLASICGFTKMGAAASRTPNLSFVAGYCLRRISRLASSNATKVAFTGAFFISSNMIFQTHPSVIVLGNQLPSSLRTNNSQLPNKRTSRFDLRQTEMILDHADIFQGSRGNRNCEI